MDLNLLVYTVFSRRIQIRIQNWTKTDPKPVFDLFSKKYVFHKNPDFYRAAASAARPFIIKLLAEQLGNAFGGVPRPQNE